MPSPISPEAGPVILPDLARKYLITPTDSEDVVAAKVARGFFVQLDPVREIPLLQSRFGGYTSGERRRDNTREHVLGKRPELCFAVATLAVKGVIPDWGNRYDVTIVDNMELTDAAIATGMQKYATSRRGESPAVDAGVQVFLTELSQVEFRTPGGVLPPHAEQ